MNIILISAFQFLVSQPAEETVEMRDSVENSQVEENSDSEKVRQFYADCRYEWIGKSGKSCAIKCVNYECHGRTDVLIPWDFCTPPHDFVADCTPSEVMYGDTTCFDTKSGIKFRINSHCM